MAVNNGKKKWGRRLGVGIIAIVHADFFYIYGTISDSLEWSYKWSLLIMGIAGFIGGFLTFTDLMNKYREKE